MGNPMKLHRGKRSPVGLIPSVSLVCLSLFLAISIRGASLAAAPSGGPASPLTDAQQSVLEKIFTISQVPQSLPTDEQPPVLQVKVANLIQEFATVNGIKLVPIPAGNFLMGSPADEAGRLHNEGPQTRVTITQDFFLGATDVTQAQWTAVMGNNPSKFVGAQRPVDRVPWTDAVAFCRKVTDKERAAGRLPDGYAYTLPTEAQWEYACRAGTTGPYAGDLDAMAWYENNSGLKSHPVATKQPNAWGLFDMHGNQCEWCLDWFAATLPGGTVTDPVGPASGFFRAARGGGWGYSTARCRSTSRFSFVPQVHFEGLGFRLAFSVVR